MQANPNIASVPISLSGAMEAEFFCSARSFYDISVSDVKLEEKRSDGKWYYVCDLSGPPSVENAASYNKSKDYSSSCEKGKTYRVLGTFNADGETSSCTSNAKTYL